MQIKLNGNKVNYLKYNGYSKSTKRGKYKIEFSQTLEEFLACNEFGDEVSKTAIDNCKRLIIYKMIEEQRNLLSLINLNFEVLNTSGIDLYNTFATELRIIANTAKKNTPPKE